MSKSGSRVQGYLKAIVVNGAFYQITAIFAGGLAPFVATALLAQFNNASWPIALYVIGMAVITFVCTYLAGETHPAIAAQVAGGGE